MIRFLTGKGLGANAVQSGMFPIPMYSDTYFMGPAIHVWSLGVRSLFMNHGQQSVIDKERHDSRLVSTML